MPKTKKRKNTRAKIRRARRLFLAFLMLFAAAALFVRAFIFDIHIVSTSAMAPIYQKGNVVMIEKRAPEEIQRGSVMYISFGAADVSLIRRIYGMPGDLIDVRENGKFLVYADESGVMREKALGDAPALVYGEIPQGAYLALSDNPEQPSGDGRTLGLIQKADVRAQAGSVIWPIANPF